MTDRDLADADADDESGLEGVRSVSVALAAGAALFNEGHVLAAHDPWETAWLPLDDGDDERLLHGLIAVAAATHHATERNWAGAVGCADNAVAYLGRVGEEHRGVAVAPLREWAHRLAADPETVERAPPPSIRIDGVAVAFADLDLASALAAAPALSESVDAGDTETLSAAADLSRAEYGTGRTAVSELIFAFLRTPDARPQIAARIADRVERARRKRRDVDGLFE